MTAESRAAEGAPVPIMTRELAAKMQDLIDSGHIDGMTCVQRLPGNPFNVRVERFGDVVATMAVGMVGPGWWNRVKGVSEGNIERLVEALAVFRESGVRSFLDIVPGVYRYFQSASLLFLV